KCAGTVGKYTTWASRPVPDSRRRTYEQASASSRGQAPNHARGACEAPERLGSEVANRVSRRRGACGGGAGGTGIPRRSPSGRGGARAPFLVGRNRNRP